MAKRLPQFGIAKEWQDFHRRQPLFDRRFSNLVKALKKAFVRTFRTKQPVDRVVFHLSNLCKEDFMEILLLAGNGYGIGAQKLLRGLYERAVTARYLSMNPERVDDFIAFGKINMFKLLEPIKRTHGKQLVPEHIVRDLTAFHKAFKSGPVKRSTSRWSGDLSFEAMAAKVGSLGRMIVYGWYLPTFMDHASLQGIIARVEETPGGGMAFDGGPQRKKADEALNWATLVMLDVLDLQKTYFGLNNLEPLLERCNADYLEIWQPKQFDELKKKQRNQKRARK
jgi:hypothetical protein